MSQIRGSNLFQRSSLLIDNMTGHDGINTVNKINSNNPRVLNKKFFKTKREKPSENPIKILIKTDGGTKLSVSDGSPWKQICPSSEITVERNTCHTCH